MGIGFSERSALDDICTKKPAQSWSWPDDAAARTIVLRTCASRRPIASRVRWLKITATTRSSAMYLSEARTLGYIRRRSESGRPQDKPRTVKKEDNAIVAVAPRLSRRAECFIKADAEVHIGTLKLMRETHSTFEGPLLKLHRALKVAVAHLTRKPARKHAP